MSDQIPLNAETAGAKPGCPPATCSARMTTESLQAAARAAHGQMPDTHGFILIVMPFGNGSGECEAQYVSNCRREDVINVLKTVLFPVLFRWGINDEWMQTIK